MNLQGADYDFDAAKLGRNNVSFSVKDSVPSSKNPSFVALANARRIGRWVSSVLFHGYSIICNMRRGVVLGVIGAVFLAIVGITIWKQNQPETVQVGGIYDYVAVKTEAEGLVFDEYEVDEIWKGEVWDNVKGDLNAPIVIYEYADYQCGHCAEINEYINKMVADYDGKVAVVFRTYVLPYSNNGMMAAAAANAAAKQGYWKEMNDVLFENQASWANLRAEKFQEKVGEYFMMASERGGDRAKFYEDMESEEVLEKIAYDMGAGMKVGLEGTPWFVINGEWFENAGVSMSRYTVQMREKINEELKK